MWSSNMSTLLARIHNNKVCPHVKLRPNAHSIWLAVQHMWSCQGRSHRGSLLLRPPGTQAQCAPEQEKSLRQVASLTNREACGSTTCLPRVSRTSVSQRCKPTRHHLQLSTCRHSQPTTEQHPPLSASMRDRECFITQKKKKTREVHGAVTGVPSCSTGGCGPTELRVTLLCFECSFLVIVSEQDAKEKLCSHQVCAT